MSRIAFASIALCLALLLSVPRAAHAAAALASSSQLADLSLEQLANIVVTSVSRREERLAQAPASIFVITAEDIRRSRATSIPEALRLAPNLDIARADINQYAISARGFNNVLANKMLVLIDGRTVYTPLFSGVFWEAQDVMLEDVDRIEVISGPGATLWGANAVNGVINIITRPARETQGLLATGLAGDRQSGAAVRYGGPAIAGGNFRVYAKYDDRDASRFANGASVYDASIHGQAGFRADWESPGRVMTLQGD
ncbi:MAG TPA: TonB-dependent receptor plug domain-containing protein, partial [Casimicrobiaceae bacterium]|nr:TonB-dependent receptor plug domain-containing protein [Casimicrobiaceae bacterium]